MDIDPGMYSSKISLSQFLTMSSDVRASSLPVRLLPYSMVPGMKINSRSFSKAVSIITKQQENSLAGARNVDNPIAGGSVSKGKKKLVGNTTGTSTTISLKTFSYIIKQTR